MPLAAQWPPAHPRVERVSAAIQDALERYATVLESGVPFRAICIEVKMRDDGAGVRTVLISFQGDTDPRTRS